MYKNLWKEIAGTICRLELRGDMGYVLETYTGFKVKSFVVTSQEIFTNEKATDVTITFYANDGFTEELKFTIDYSEFIEELRVGPGSNKWGFGVIDADFLSDKRQKSLIMSSSEDVEVGQEIVVLGSGSKNNLSLCHGIVTGKYVDNGVVKIQHDITVDCSFAGAPIVDPVTQKIIGVLSENDDPIALTYKQIQELSDNNILRLKGVSEKLIVDDIDIVQVLQVGQQQIKHLSKVLYNSARVKGIDGCEIKGLATFLESSDHIEKRIKRFAVKSLSFQIE
jgi:hypothetical protein